MAPLETEMAVAHRNDYADLHTIRELRAAIDSFLADPPKRAHRTALEYLRNAAKDLKDDEAHIVRVWD